MELRQWRLHRNIQTVSRSRVPNGRFERYSASTTLPYDRRAREKITSPDPPNLEVHKSYFRLRLDSLYSHGKFVMVPAYPRIDQRPNI